MRKLAQFQGFVQTFLEAGKRLADGKIPIVSRDTATTRFEACINCDHYEMGHCKVCGCFMRPKTWLESGTCPYKKWGNPTKEQAEINAKLVTAYEKGERPKFENVDLK